MVTYPELKKVLFITQTIVGCLLIALSLQLGMGPGSLELSALIACLTLMITGCICVLFGLTTFFLREDPEVWR